MIGHALQEEDDDVFDRVDEDEYVNLVEERRKGDDFVVDDEGLGYHDDGEEHWGGGDEPVDGKDLMPNIAINYIMH